MSPAIFLDQARFQVRHFAICYLLGPPLFSW